jgi:hypothetical protein
LKLRVSEPLRLRPYRSPGGVFVPSLGLLLGLGIFIACFIADVNWSVFSLGVLAVMTIIFSMSEARHQRLRKVGSPR